jgi:hypothetical protein
MPGRQGAIRSAPFSHAGFAAVLVSVAVLAWAAPASANPVFLSPIDLSDAGQDAFEPKLVVDQSGNEHHIWTRWDGANTRIQYRLRNQAGNLDPVQTLSTAGRNASQGALDVDDDGNVIVVWTESQGASVLVMAVARLAGGSFGSVQTVSASGQVADRPRVSIDSEGKAVAVWIQYAGANGQIQAATRPAGGTFGGVQTISEPGQDAFDARVDSGPIADENATAVWSRSDGSKLRVQSARRRDVIGFPRPAGASPLRASLVPAYNACTSANRTHGPALAYPSCNPPVRSSGPLTVGTPDANGFSASSVSYVRFGVVTGNPSAPPDEADIAISVSITDVRNSAGGSDYAGRLLVTSVLKITDNANAAERPEPATTQEEAFQFPVQCSVTAETTRGGTCNLTTTYDALIPGAVTERQRAIWALDQVQVKDAGPNGTGYASCPPTCGDGDETVFMREGIFIP